MSVKVELDAVSASYLVGVAVSRLRRQDMSDDERDLLNHAVAALRVGIEVANYGPKYTITPADAYPPIEPAPV